MNTEYKNAIKTIMIYYFPDEEINFKMYWNDYIDSCDEKPSKEQFLDYLKEHALYALIVLKFADDRKEFDKYIHQLWENKN